MPGLEVGGEGRRRREQPTPPLPSPRLSPARSVFWKHLAASTHAEAASCLASSLVWTSASFSYVQPASFPGESGGELGEGRERGVRVVGRAPWPRGCVAGPRASGSPRPTTRTPPVGSRAMSAVEQGPAPGFPVRGWSWRDATGVDRAARAQRAREQAIGSARSPPPEKPPRPTPHTHKPWPACTGRPPFPAVPPRPHTCCRRSQRTPASCRPWRPGRLRFWPTFFGGVCLCFENLSLLL